MSKQNSAHVADSADVTNIIEGLNKRWTKEKQQLLHDIRAHEAATKFPLLADSELIALAEDIRDNGQRDPITIYEDQILDGRNRWLACKLIRIEPKTEKWDAGEDESPWRFVWSRNARRRDLAAGQKAAIWYEIKEGDETWQAKRETITRSANAARSRAAKAQPRTETGTYVSGGGHQSTATGNAKRQSDRHPERREAAREAGVSETTMAYIAELRKKAPDLAKQVKDGKIALKAAWRELKRREKQAEIEAAAKTLKLDPKRVDLRHCSMQELLSKLKDIDAIITDPPYPEKFLPLYGELAKLAKKALKPSGILAVMCGQSYLPEILAAMTAYMPYRWTVAYLTPGGQAVQAWNRKIQCFWKPILIFGAAPTWASDVIKSDVNDNDKRFHDWGQSESGMFRLVEALTKPKQLVCDPFMGAGTTGIACVAAHRKFTGCDIDEKQVEIARGRIVEVVRGLSIQ